MFCIGTAINGTISAFTGIRSPMLVSIIIVVTPSCWYEREVVPNDERATCSVVVGTICSDLANCSEMNER